MLTADMVRARRRGDQLQLIQLSAPARSRAIELAAQYTAAARTCIGRTREELDRACPLGAVSAKDRRLAAGLRKLVQDRCTFEEEPEVDVRALRRTLFTRASAVRQRGDPNQPFDRQTLVAEVAAELDMAPRDIGRLLYADLRAAQRLLAFLPIEPEALVDRYVDAQAQAVLLRALQVVIEVRCANPAAYRRLFHKAKFLRLLHTIEPLDDGGYRITIDGPYSLFRSTTRYGLQLALLLPTVRACQTWSLRADVTWQRHRPPLEFVQQGKGTEEGGCDDAPSMSPGVAELVRKFDKRDSPWRVRPAQKVLSLPGVGLCVPDLLFEHRDTGASIHLELLGFWSRAAVWKRVQLVEDGLTAPMIFAVSDRLRVSEAALSDNTTAALYVYKGVMLPGALERKLDQLTKRIATGR